MMKTKNTNSKPANTRSDELSSEIISTYIFNLLDNILKKCRKDRTYPI